MEKVFLSILLADDTQAGKGGELTRDETTIIAGALQLTGKTARDAMTPISETFSVDINAKFDRYDEFL
jgi:metal transporter CNNM